MCSVQSCDYKVLCNIINFGSMHAIIINFKMLSMLSSCLLCHRRATTRTLNLPFILTSSSSSSLLLLDIPQFDEANENLDDIKKDSYKNLRKVSKSLPRSGKASISVLYSKSFTTWIKGHSIQMMVLKYIKVALLYFMSYYSIDL